MEIELPGSQGLVRPGKLVCVGRNYALHAAEMKSEVPQEPILFLKPPSALIANGDEVIIPGMSQEVHHEVELVIAIGKRARFVTEADAMSRVAGYALGLDMTARDLQAAAKKGGKPWSVAKGFDTFAPLGVFVAAADVENVGNLEIRLARNGNIVQSGNTRDMIFSPAFLIHYISRIFTLEPGDLIFTGTPEGVGPVAAGDVLEASATGLPSLRVRVVAERTSRES